MKSIQERFDAKVDKTSGCWLWTGAKQNQRRSQPVGYGVLVLSNHPRVAALAHRVSWELHNGPIPVRKNVLHKCDNPPCVNPEHLFLGTQIDNIKDCVSKGRKERGEDAASAVLTEKEVIDIKKRLRDGDTVVHVAQDYGRPHGTIWAISSGRSWRHVNG